jgi:hypothetical protein
MSALKTDKICPDVLEDNVSETIDTSKTPARLQVAPETDKDFHFHKVDTRNRIDELTKFGNLGISIKGKHTDIDNLVGTKTVFHLQSGKNPATVFDVGGSKPAFTQSGRTNNVYEMWGANKAKEHYGNVELTNIKNEPKTMMEKAELIEKVKDSMNNESGQRSKQFAEEFMNKVNGRNNNNNEVELGGGFEESKATDSSTPSKPSSPETIPVTPAVGTSSAGGRSQSIANVKAKFDSLSGEKQKSIKSKGKKGFGSKSTPAKEPSEFQKDLSAEATTPVVLPSGAGAGAGVGDSTTKKWKKLAQKAEVRQDVDDLKELATTLNSAKQQARDSGLFVFSKSVEKDIQRNVQEMVDASSDTSAQYFDFVARLIVKHYHKPHKIMEDFNQDVRTAGENASELRSVYNKYKKFVGFPDIHGNSKKALKPGIDDLQERLKQSVEYCNSKGYTLN